MTVMSTLKKKLPGRTERVPAHTAPWVNRRISRNTARRIRYYAEHPGEIDGRLTALEREWDIERTLEANAASLALLGIGLGLRDRRFLALPGIVTGFLLMHALHGWCPPIPLFRRLGVRTDAEIQAERNSLKALREALPDLEQQQEKTTGQKSK
jgi:hypothetical protein